MFTTHDRPEITLIQVKRVAHLRHERAGLDGDGQHAPPAQVNMAKQTDGTACGYLVPAVQHFICQMVSADAQFGQDVDKTIR